MTGADLCRRALTATEAVVLSAQDALREARQVMSGISADREAATYLAVFAILAGAARFPKVKTDAC